MQPCDFPLAYHITFATYGARLPGHPTGWVDRRENRYGTPHRPGQPRLKTQIEAGLIHPPYELDALRRSTVLSAIQEACEYRHWILEAAHVRLRHSHCVVAAQAPPEFVLNTLKCYASRKLNRAGLDPLKPKRWARHGSMRYLWTEASVEEAIEYVLLGQGVLMSAYRKTNPSPDECPAR